MVPFRVFPSIPGGSFFLFKSSVFFFFFFFGGGGLEFEGNYRITAIVFVVAERDHGIIFRNRLIEWFIQSGEFRPVMKVLRTS